VCPNQQFISLQRKKKQKLEQKAVTEGRWEQTELHTDPSLQDAFYCPRHPTAGIKERSKTKPNLHKSNCIQKFFPREYKWMQQKNSDANFLNEHI